MNWEMLGRTPAIVTAVTSMSVLLSVIYEWGYFAALEGDWRSNLLIKDYAVLAVEWLPAAAAIGAVELILARNLVLILRKRIAKDADGRPLHEPFFMNPWISLPPIIAIVLFLYAFSNSDAWLAGAGGLGGMTWLLVGGRLMRSRWRDRGLHYGEFILILGPALLSLVFSFGLGNGLRATTHQEQTYTITLKGEKEPRRVSVLKSIERGILVRDFELMKNEFLVWSEIVSVGIEAKDRKHERPICRLVDLKVCEAHSGASSVRHQTTRNSHPAAGAPQERLYTVGMAAGVMRGLTNTSGIASESPFP